MSKGETNELTEIMQEAERVVEELDTSLATHYGLPLYVTDPGKSPTAALAWPEDPDELTPEEMAVLVATRGKDAVNEWLSEHFYAAAEREAFAGEIEE